MSEGQIYFLQEQRHLDDARDFIKVGWSRMPGVRVDVIDCASSVPLKCLALIPGSRKQEQELHKLLSPFRVKGEWFEPCPVIWAMVKSSQLPDMLRILAVKKEPKRKVTFDVHEEEMPLLRRMKSHSFDIGILARDFIVKAIREKLDREGALPDKPKKK